MPQIIAFQGAGTRPTIPEPGHQDISPEQAAVLDGRSRNPETGVHRVKDAGNTVVADGNEPTIRAKGFMDRWLGRSMPVVQTVDQASEVQNRGLHVAMTAGPAIPTGRQTPPPARQNTWRAAPKPWDAGNFVGMPEAH